MSDFRVINFRQIIHNYLLNRSGVTGLCNLLNVWLSFDNFCARVRISQFSYNSFTIICLNVQFTLTFDNFGVYLRTYFTVQLQFIQLFFWNVWFIFTLDNFCVYACILTVQLQLIHSYFCWNVRFTLTVDNLCAYLCMYFTVQVWQDRHKLLNPDVHHYPLHWNGVFPQLPPLPLSLSLSLSPPPPPSLSVA